MHVSYISSFDATDITRYSGTGYYIPAKLKEVGDEVSYVGDLCKINPLSHRTKSRLYRLSGKKYLVERNPKVLQLWADTIKKNVNPRADVLVSYSSQPFAKLDVKKPRVFWADAVFANMIGYYPGFSNLCEESIRDGNLMELASLQNANVAVLSSEWAAKAAIHHYGIDPAKVKVVNYGANIDVNYSLDDILDRAKAKSFKQCRLLFIGVQWHRKGGDIAVEVARKLNEKGIKTILTIVGVDPGKEIRSLDFVKCHGFIAKADEKGKKMFNDLISDSHFLILPTRADCTPIVYNEMNAHGIPVITTNEGGIPSIITNGVNGFMFDKNAGAGTFADCIAYYFTHKSEYLELSKSSFNEYKTRLNWESSIKKFRNIVHELL
jgi:glycosyltransferase involved in cell wall biosynthesis